MSEQDAPRPTPSDDLDAELVAAEVAKFRRIGNDLEYADVITDLLLNRDTEPESFAAIRSTHLAERSRTVLVQKIQRINEDLARDQKTGALSRQDPAWRQKAVHVRNIIGMERTRLEAILAGRAAELGQVRNAPNPRARAMRALWEMALRGEPIDRSTPRDLLNREIEAVKKRKKAPKTRAEEATARARREYRAAGKHQAR